MQSMVCNVIFSFVTLLTLQRTKLRYRLQKARGDRQAERAGVRMDARRAKTGGLGLRQPPPGRGTHKILQREEFDRAGE